ncbi:hypothetical protein Kirov_184 [Bacillus phage Kirov]|uniref:Uncharacterized protein n=1 Tax=Bacillus phage Kirov TaxID=2783539 RepID=A0A7U3NKM2_9CAUD|nr:hypothetical protein PQE67_gp120 [Bacillus phage Kirov]QOV08383.1 hypothetical protein Kirov_184 [Bacillus phage Kirov]
MKTYLKVFAEAYWYMLMLGIASLIVYFVTGTDALKPSWGMLFSPIPVGVLVAFLHLKFGAFKDIFGEEYLKSVDKRQK